MGLVAVTVAYECTFTAPDGAEYDLTPLRKISPPDYSSKVGGQYEYRSNICGTTFQPCNGDTSGIATQWNIDGRCVAVLGRQNPVFGVGNPPEFTYIDPNAPEKGVTLKYQNGDVCIDIGFIERTVTYTIKCDPSAKASVIQAVETSPCQYQIDFASKSACPPVPETNLNDNSTRRKKKVNRGTWLLLTVAVGVTVYCGVGIYINKKRHGMELLESIPNKEFWSEVPAMLRELVASMVARVRNWRRTDSEGRVSI